MSVHIFYEDTEILDYDPEFFVLWLARLCESHGRILGEVSIVFCSDEYLLNINKKYLDHDYYTDIITFDYSEHPIVSGDLFISIDMVTANADEYNSTRENELNRVVAHGLLHLIGFNDKTPDEAREMRIMEKEALRLIVPRET